MKNVIDLKEEVCTNNDNDPRFGHKQDVYHFSQSSPTYLVHIHLENLINTFGADIVAKVAARDLNLKAKPETKKKVG